MEKPEPCKCLNWCSNDLGIILLTGHHENCPNNPGIMAGTRTLLTKLVRGIERWGLEGDGIYDPLWDSYVQAKGVLGEGVTEVQFIEPEFDHGDHADRP